MSDRRYKKNYSIDGWPIEDTETQSVLHTDDLVLLLNQKHDKIQSLEAELERVKKQLDIEIEMSRELLREGGQLNQVIAAQSTRGT